MSFQNSDSNQTLPFPPPLRAWIKVDVPHLETCDSEVGAGTSSLSQKCSILVFLCTWDGKAPSSSSRWGHAAPCSPRCRVHQSNRCVGKENPLIPAVGFHLSSCRPRSPKTPVRGVIHRVSHLNFDLCYSRCIK